MLKSSVARCVSVLSRTLPASAIRRDVACFRHTGGACVCVYWICDCKYFTTYKKTALLHFVVESAVCVSTVLLCL